METQTQRSYKTSKEYREKVKAYEDGIRKNNPEKYQQRLEYHRKRYREMKEALAKMKSLGFYQQNSHEIVTE